MLAILVSISMGKYIKLVVIMEQFYDILKWKDMEGNSCNSVLTIGSIALESVRYCELEVSSIKSFTIFIIVQGNVWNENPSCLWIDHD